MKTTTFFLAVCFCLVALGCRQDKIDTKAELEKLMQVSRDWSAAASKPDLQKILDYWEDDAVVISAGEPDKKGKEAIKQMVEGLLNNPNFKISWEPISGEVSQRGDMGYLLENSKITVRDSSGTEQIMNFKTVTIWKKQKDGSWKNIVDVMSPTTLK
jgi:uncharacterized protein (TIGR02246 family)